MQIKPFKALFPKTHLIESTSDFCDDAKNSFKKYLETGLLREGGRLHIRVVAESAEGSNFRKVEPTLEDAYIWLMREGKNGTK